MGALNTLVLTEYIQTQNSSLVKLFEENYLEEKGQKKYFRTDKIVKIWLKCCEKEFL